MKKISLGCLIFIFNCSPTTESSVSSETEKAIESQELPLTERFSFQDLQGNKVDWDETKGKVVFINFWATWCKPCIKEMPSISEAYDQLKKDQILFIIASDEEVEKIKRFKGKHTYSFRLMHTSTTLFELDIQALPTTIIINKKGEIVFKEVGARNWSSDKSIELIESFIVQE